jgi:hypothetical protein
MLNYARNMRESITYWPPAGNDGFGGITFGAPETIKVRWQDKADLFRDPSGKEQVSASVVYCAVPLEIQGWLFRGASVASDPRTVPGASEIKQRGDSSDLPQERTLSKVWL